MYVCLSLSLSLYIYIYIYCDMWAISRKRMGKYVVTDKFIPEYQLITEHGFQGYGN
jgi:hypothetical protein